MFCQIPPGVFHAAVPIEFLQVKLLDQFILRRAAVQDTDKDVARAFEASKSLAIPPSPPALPVIAAAAMARPELDGLSGGIKRAVDS